MRQTLRALFVLTTTLLFAVGPAAVLHAAPTGVTLAWDPSSGATGYRVYYGPTPGNYTGVIDAGAQTTATVPASTTNQAYYFVVRAYNAAGEGAPSAEVGAWVGAVWQTPSLLTVGDFGGDGIADPFVYRGTTGEWFARKSKGGTGYAAWGAPALGDVPVPGDYDGDGKLDFAVYRSTTGEWLINFSKGGSRIVSWGAPSLGDLPVPKDYDGDGKADIAIFRQSTGEWFILQSSTGTARRVAWGAPGGGDVPVPGDYDGNGKADFAVYRQATGQLFIAYDNGTTTTQTWGSSVWGDVPVPADYDGDGKIDIGVFRRVTGTWLLLLSRTNQVRQVGWGATALGDIPVPGDYDGDGQADIAVFRSSTATWYISYTRGGSTSFSWGSPASADTVGGEQQVTVTQIE